jgi:hypothetical protein
LNAGPADRLVDIVDVDEHLEPGTLAEPASVLVRRPAGIDDSQLGSSTPHPDIVGLTLSRKPEMGLETEPLTEGDRRRDRVA